MRFFNRAYDRAELLIYDLIGSTFFFDGIDPTEFRAELMSLGDVPEIDVRINSEGGEVFAGYAMFNALDQHPAHKTIHVDGVAGSIASLFPFVSNATVNMGAKSWIMAHDAYSIFPGQVLNAVEVGQYISQLTLDGQRLEKLTADIAEVYMRRVNVPMAEVRQHMAEEWWINAEEAVALGIADSRYESKMAAAVRRNYSHAPGDVKILDYDEVPPAIVVEEEDEGTPNLERAELRRRIAVARST